MVRQVWYESWYLLLHFMSVFISHNTFVNGQCFGGTETYEKTTGVNFVYGTSQGILTQPGTGITRDCTAICRQTPTCYAFTVDYDNSRCQSYTVESSGRRNSLQEKIGVNYFEKICLRGVSNLNVMCGDRLWAFERVVGAYLEDFDDREEHNIQSKSECEKLCMLENSFTCRSAEYDESLNICRLSREDRRSQPNAFRHQPGTTVDYLENQCVRSLPDCRYNVRQGNSVISMDELQFAASQGECEALCDQARGFTCRAFTYAPAEKRCYLSGDDSVSLNNAPLLLKNSAVYAEKQCSISQCEDGLFTFEKVTGHFLRSAQQVGLAMAASPGITLECGARCLEAGSDCPAFTLDYNAMKCFKLDRNTQGRGSELSRREGQSYFEKICLRGNIRGCGGRAWAFERQPGKELRGHDDIKLTLVQSRRDCMEACLRERRFDCRSAEYDTQTAECRLTSEDRRTRPNDYVDAPPTTEYLENQCLQEESRCHFKPVPNSYPRYLDIVLPLVTDEAECERRCQEYSDFICRSFSYYPSGSQCFISGDDRASAGTEALMSRPGTNYLERSCHVGTDPILGESPAGSCAVGRTEFEKITGYELQGQRAYRLLRDNTPGIAAKCVQQCQSNPRCLGFNLDYNRNECVGVESNAEKNRIDLRQVPGIAYFEAVCLRGATCGLAWTFERIFNYELRGFVSAQYSGISKTECEERCLEERTFPCRSISYNFHRQECRLSAEDRTTQPQVFEPSPDFDYIENLCSVPSTRCPYRNMQRDHQLIYVDKSLSAFSDSSCQHACDVEREFLCQSFTFLSQSGLNTNQCLLSGTTVTAVGKSGFQIQSGALYAEKDCSNIIPPVQGGQDPRPPPNKPGIYPEDGLISGLNPYPCRYSLTYEKIAGADYPVSKREPIRTRADIGISGECLIHCAQMRQHCLAVTLEVERGGRQHCFALTRSANSDGSGTLQPAPDFAYFQKICLQARPCSKAWTFTRIPSYELDSPNAIEVHNMYDRRQCQDECLSETKIVCRSATFYARERLCKLSAETRRTQPQHFRRSNGEVDYMENECAPPLPSCEYTDLPGRYLPYTDRFLPQIFDVGECKRLCDNERDFPCRSFNFNAVRRECFLSSDDTFAADRSALLVDREFFYGERGTCSNVRVDCTQADMLITFLFGLPFEGRVYATGNPQACFEMGNGQAQIMLRIPMGTQCGTIQQGRGRYVNHVVIQQNPVIMQETDKTVRVECSFDASDQTVSYAPSGTRDQEGGGISVTVPFRPSGTNIVTNTAPTPNVRMRILKRNGQEAAVVGLGEELELRIEIDPTSAFGIFVRNLEARTDNGELLTLIDNVGCPRDPNIFPPLRVGHNRDLSADFKAFRFPSTATVNFVATVQFCQDTCEQIHCSNGVHSYGRKKRSAGASLENTKKNKTDLSVSKVMKRQESLEKSDSALDNNTVNDDIINDTTTELFNPKDSSIDSSSAVMDLEISNYTDMNESKISSETDISEAKARKNESADIEVPSELPLHLQLVVGENSIPKTFNNTKLYEVKERRMYLSNETAVLYQDKSPSYVLSKGLSSEDSYVCVTKTTAVSSLLVVLIFNVGIIAGFVIFYYVRKKQWKKHNMVQSSFPTVSIPEVLFRNVYDRLPTNSLFNTLEPQVST